MLGRSLHKPCLSTVLSACLYASDKAILDERVSGSTWQVFYIQEKMDLPFAYIFSLFISDKLRTYAFRTTIF
jgi:hypothetical protein